MSLLVLIAVPLTACSNSSSRALVGSTTTLSPTPTDTVPDRPSLLQPPPGFRIPDTRSVVLRKADGRTSPRQVPVQGGRSSVSGTVVGPDGAVGGATVLIERFVGTESGSIVVSTDGGGNFSVESLLGGRYRVRAWLQPSLATLDAPTGFVADGDHLSFKVGVERHDAIRLQVASAVTALTVGVPFGVNGLLSQESVDDQGIIHTVGVAGISVSLSSPGSLTIDAPNPVATGPDGRLRWSVTCWAPGSHPVTASVATVGAATLTVTASTTLPACADPQAAVPTTSTTLKGPP